MPTRVSLATAGSVTADDLNAGAASVDKNIEEQIIKANLRIDEIEREKTSHTSKISSNKTMIQNCERDVKNKLDIITQIVSEFENVVLSVECLHCLR